MGGARSRFDKGFCAEVVDRLSAESIDRLEELVTGRDGFLVELKSDPGPLGLDTLLEEIVKLGRAKAIRLPADLLSGYSEKLVAAWRARAAACYPSDLLANPLRRADRRHRRRGDPLLAPRNQHPALR